MQSLDRKSSTTVRIPGSILDILDDLVKRKIFKDRSETIITLIQDGLQFKKIILMMNDPNQVKKAIKKIKKIEAINDVKKTLRDFEPHELSLIAKIAKSLEEEKVQQTFLNMKS